MPESLKNPPQWVNYVTLVTGVVSVMGIIFTAISLYTGAATGAGVAAHDISLIKGQITDLSSQMARLQDRIESGPRADQMREIDRHLSALDGRGDVLDQRLRLIEQQQAGMAAQLQGIDAASRARLGGK